MNMLHRLIIAKLAVGLLLSGLYGAWSQPLPGYFNPLAYASSATDATITPTYNSTQSTVSLTHTYASASLGTASSDRVIIVAWSLQPNSSAITSCTSNIAGVAGTLAIFSSQSNRKDSVIFAAAVPTGTTGSVSITCDQNIFGSIINVYATTGLTSTTATHTGSNNANPAIVALNVSAGGVAVGVVSDEGTGTYTWTNLTEYTDQSFGSGAVGSSAYGAFSAAQTGLSIQANSSSPSANNPLLAAASFR